VSFCAQSNCTDGQIPQFSPAIDAVGNLFGTTIFGGAHNGGTLFEIVKTHHGYASPPTILYSFGSQAEDGDDPEGSLILDAIGNIFGMTQAGGAHLGKGTVFELAKTASGYASTPNILYSFCALPDCADGSFPSFGSLIADAKGNLFGTTEGGGPEFSGTVFEITDSGFVSFFAGTPGHPSCRDRTVSALEKRFGGVAAASGALSYTGVKALEDAIEDFCEKRNEPRRPG
jgi:hypothetical protein